MQRFAWLESDGHTWNLLMQLDADPSASTRRWSDERRALTELAKEGWTVIRPYPPLPPGMGNEVVCGYGLARGFVGAGDGLTTATTEGVPTPTVYRDP